MAGPLKSLENRELGVIVDAAEREKIIGLCLPFLPEYARKRSFHAAMVTFFSCICISLTCIAAGFAKMRFPDALKDSPGFELAVAVAILAAPAAWLVWYFTKRSFQDACVAIRDTVITVQPIPRSLEYSSVTDLHIAKNVWKTQWVLSARGTRKQILVRIDARPDLDKIIEELVESLAHSKEAGTLSEWMEYRQRLYEAEQQDAPSVVDFQGL